MRTWKETPKISVSDKLDSNDIDMNAEFFLFSVMKERDKVLLEDDLYADGKSTNSLYGMQLVCS